MELATSGDVGEQRLRACRADHRVRRLRLFGSALHGTLRAESVPTTR
ncbi:MAG TPA: hypothetical protein VMW08_17320 [Acidimicrobiales bacterium]|nr:hypothetical protein [Acidimicrobiales bacterium]